MKEQTLRNNFVYNTIYVLISIGYPLILTPYLSRTLGADGIGTVDYAISIVNFFLTFASLGIPNYGVREIANCKEDEKRLFKTFFELFTINIISSLSCSWIYYVAVSRFSVFFAYKNIFYILGFLLIFNSFQISWFFQGLTYYRVITVRSLFVKIITLLFVFSFVKNDDDYYVYAIIYVVAHVGENVFNIIKSRQYLKRTKIKIDLSRHFKPILVMLFTQLAVNIYANLDTAMLGSIVGTRAVGYYSNAHKIIKLLGSLAASLSTVLLPRLSLLASKKNYEDLKVLIVNSLNCLIFISFAFGSGVILIADELIPVFCGQGYEPSIVVLKIMGVLVPVLTIGNLFGTQVLISFNAEKKLMHSVILSAIINFGLNSLLITKYQQNGVAIASVIAEFVALVYQFIASLHYVKIEFDFVELVKEIVAIVAMFLVRNILSQYVMGTYQRFFSYIIICATIYIVVSYALRNKGFLYLLNIMKERDLVK